MSLPARRAGKVLSRIYGFSKLHDIKHIWAPLDLRHINIDFLHVFERLTCGWATKDAKNLELMLIVILILYGGCQNRL